MLNFALFTVNGEESHLPLSVTYAGSGIVVTKSAPPQKYIFVSCEPDTTPGHRLVFKWRSPPMKLIPWSIHLVVCLTTGPKPLPKEALHIVRSRASSFKWEYPLLSLRSFSSFLRLLPRLPVTPIPPFSLHSVTCCRRHFLRKIWPIQLAFHLFISCKIFLCSLTLSKTSSFLHCLYRLNKCYTFFILVVNQLDAKNLFYNKFISCLYMFRASYTYRQEVKIVLYSL